MKRTNQSKQKSLRQELENYASSHNKILRKAVKSMNPIILLRNAHPIYRSDFARDFKNAGLISQLDANEFIKIR